MVVKVKVENLDKEVRKQLETYNGDVKKNLNKAVKEVAEYTANSLKQGGPYKERTGKYTPDWTATLRKGKYSSVTMTEEYSVNNRKHYQLTHLLEYGHVNRRGSRIVGKTRAFEHIKPAEELADQMILSKVNEAVRNANGGI